MATPDSCHYWYILSNLVIVVCVVKSKSKLTPVGDESFEKPGDSKFESKDVIEFNSEQMPSFEHLPASSPVVKLPPIKGA